MISGGHCLVRCLEAQGITRVFCVPGESYLDVLDGLHDAAIDTVVARHEGGAAIMAEADGKMTGRPGIALVTRGPGATNAACGVHIAKQDSTPMLLFVGQIGRHMKGREAFQEVDYRQTFRDLAKWVEEIDQADRIPEVIAHAFHVAMSGRPGPVVLALPEDMLRDQTDARPGPRVEVASPAPAPDATRRAVDLLRTAERPIVVLGGSRWSADAVRKTQGLAERWDLPVGVSFRRQQLFDHLHPNYAGDVGLGINHRLKARIADSDLVLLLGARFSENPSQDFSLLDIPAPRQTLIHVHPGPEELGRIYTPDLAINATPDTFLDALADASPQSASQGRAAAAHQDYLDWTATPQRADASPDHVDMGAVIGHLRDTLPEDAILTNGAGNYAIWLHRFYRFGGYGTQLAPTSGSMGYGLPAAVAAKLRHPDRSVVCFAGDGCFQMTGQEFATAAQADAAVIVIVADNGMYGTIRMHQERAYPGRVSATGLGNPDFAALARAHGGIGLSVTRSADFPAAFAEARVADRPALIHLKTDPDVITPVAKLSEM